MGKIDKNCHVAAYINTLKSVFQGLLKRDGFNKKKAINNIYKALKDMHFSKSRSF